MPEIKGEPKYKVGDTVTIKDFSVDSLYRFGLNSEMIELSGHSFKIRDVIPAAPSLGRIIPDDGYRYKLEGNSWSWASSMFVEATGSIDSSIDAFINKNKCPELEFKL